MEQKLTIYDIAKDLGVSASTISRVVNNKPGVHKKTKEKVLSYLSSHPYSPNEAARGLVNQSSKMIGILISDMRVGHHTEGVYYIERECAKYGYCSIILNTGITEEEKITAIKILCQRRVEAAVLMGSTFQSDKIQDALSRYLSNIPIIMANGQLDLPNVYGIKADDQNGVSECVKLLKTKGKKHLAFIMGHKTPSNYLKKLGFQAGMMQHFPNTPVQVFYCDGTTSGSKQITTAILTQNPQIDGLIYATDIIATGGLLALKDLGLQVPTQVALIGIDNSALCQICHPTLTSLDNKLKEMSSLAARNLVDLLNNKPVSKNMMILSSIVERETT